MKIIVELGWTVQDFEGLGLDNYVDYYKKYYNEYDILIDEYAEAIYYEVDVFQLPIEGQRVGTKFGTCIVSYSYLDLDNRNNGYYNKSRIVVVEE